MVQAEKTGREVGPFFDERFFETMKKIEDDPNNEDAIKTLMEYIEEYREEQGYREGFAEEVFHYYDSEKTRGPVYRFFEEVTKQVKKEQEAQNLAV